MVYVANVQSVKFNPFPGFWSFGAGDGAGNAAWGVSCKNRGTRRSG